MRLLKKIHERYRYSVILLRQLVSTDFKLRYQGSLLGYAWSLLRPLLLFLVLYLVFSVFLPVGKGVPNYPVYLLLGIVLWNFFTEITSGSVTAIVGRGDLIRKLNFPKYNIILAVSLSALINMALNFVIIGIFMAVNHVGLSVKDWLILPLIVELYVLAMGIGFLLSALYVRFRDVSYIWEVILQAGFYATPIIYPLTKITNHHVQEALILNPVAQVIQDARDAIVTPASLTIKDVFGGDQAILAIPVCLSILLFVWGALYFRGRSKFFAEDV